MALILGIESSCDDTSVAVVRDGRYILSNSTHTQIEHKQYGGVVPEVASRMHIQKIDSLVKQALETSNIAPGMLDAVAVTCGPGLVGALLVGVSFAKSYAYAVNRKLIGVHHIEGHICANYLESDFEPPFMALVASGGHTHLVYVTGYNKYEILGITRDDAAGEAFDKVGRALGLSYPGGAEIDRLAKTGNPDAIEFPRALIDNEMSFDFSFSGLKSSVLNYLNKHQMNNSEINTADIAASFQESVVDVLVQKTITACKLRKVKKMALAGGVACNSRLRYVLSEVCRREGITLNYPEPQFCTDNASMIASCAYYYFLEGWESSLNLNAYPSLKLGDSSLYKRGETGNE